MSKASSDRDEYGRRRVSHGEGSGDLRRPVRLSTLHRLTCWLRSRALPKSTSFRWPCWSSSRFSGFRSRCTTCSSRINHGQRICCMPSGAYRHCSSPVAHPAASAQLTLQHTHFLCRCGDRSQNDSLNHAALSAKAALTSGHCLQCATVHQHCGHGVISHLLLPEVFKHQHDLRSIETRHIRWQPLPCLYLIVQLACKNPDTGSSFCELTAARRKICGRCSCSPCCEAGS